MHTRQEQEIFHYLSTIKTRLTDMDILSSSREEVVRKLPKNECVYISVDVDALSFLIMPQTGYPAPLGMSESMLFCILDYIIKHNDLIGIDIMEFGQTNQHEKHQHVATLLNSLILNIIQSTCSKKQRQA